MLDARIAPACLAVGLLLGGCGPNQHRVPGAGAAGATAPGGAGVSGGGAAGSDAGGSAGGAGKGEVAEGGAGEGGNAGGAGECGRLGSGGRGGAPAAIGTDLGALQVEGVAPWKGNAKGAYTIVHDDVCDYNIDSLFNTAEPELTQRGLRAAFGAIVQRCQERKLWAKLETVRQHGHEIINHTWDHKDLVVDAATAPLDLQIDQAGRVLDENLVDQHTSFFIFPYDSFDDTKLAHLGSLGYLGARAGARGLNDVGFSDGLRVMFDVYGGEYSIYDGQGDILKIYVDLAISQGGWAMREFHGIADDTFSPVSLADYRAHLDYVKAKQESGELWVDTPSAVLRYHFSRLHCGVPAISGATLEPATPSCECGRYATPLSVIVTSAQDAPSAMATQDGKLLVTKKLGPNRFLLDVDPLGGAVAVGGGN